jgi:NAD-dependent deacetylase
MAAVAEIKRLDCGGVALEQARLRMAGGPDGLPRCQRCGGPLKPDVVLFGELLPEALAPA